MPISEDKNTLAEFKSRDIFQNVIQKLTIQINSIYKALEY